MKNALSILTLLCTPMLGCSDPATVEGSGTSGEPEASTSAASDVSTSDGTTDAAVSSSSTTSEGIDADTTSDPPEHVCGDGLVEADEACDDGNEVDADGCNRDCTMSGSLLWTFDFPSGLTDLRIDVDALDQLHALALDGGVEIAHFVFSPEGELISQEVLDVPSPSPPEGLVWDRRDLGVFRVSNAAPVFAFVDVFRGPRGAIDWALMVQSVDPAWILDWGRDEGTRFDFDVADDGRLFGMRGDFAVLSTQGEVLATGPQTNARLVAAGASGATFAGREVTRHDADGAVAWSVDWPSGALTGTRAIERFSGGDVLVYGEVGESVIDERQLRLVRYSPDGEEVSAWTWPDAVAEDAYPSYEGLAISPQGHITILGSEDDVQFIWKMNEDYTTRWRTELPPNSDTRRIVSDSTGALFVHGRSGVSKYAR